MKDQIIQALKSGEEDVVAIAARFQVSPAYVRKLRRELYSPQQPRPVLERRLNTLTTQTVRKVQQMLKDDRLSERSTLLLLKILLEHQRGMYHVQLSYNNVFVDARSQTMAPVDMTALVDMLDERLNTDDLRRIVQTEASE